MVSFILLLWFFPNHFFKSARHINVTLAFSLSIHFLRSTLRKNNICIKITSQQKMLFYSVRYDRDQKVICLDVSLVRCFTKPLSLVYYFLWQRLQCLWGKLYDISCLQGCHYSHPSHVLCKHGNSLKNHRAWKNVVYKATLEGMTDEIHCLEVIWFLHDSWWGNSFEFFL